MQYNSTALWGKFVILGNINKVNLTSLVSGYQKQLQPYVLWTGGRIYSLMLLLAKKKGLLNEYLIVLFSQITVWVINLPVEYIFKQEASGNRKLKPLWQITGCYSAAPSPCVAVVLNHSSRKLTSSASFPFAAVFITADTEVFSLSQLLMTKTV